MIFIMCYVPVCYRKLLLQSYNISNRISLFHTPVTPKNSCFPVLLPETLYSFRGMMKKISNKFSSVKLWFFHLHSGHLSLSIQSDAFEVN